MLYLVSALITTNKCPFCGPFSAMFHIVCLELVISLFEMVPKCRAEALSSVSK